MMISYFKVRPEVVAPERAHPSDAGCDVFFNPENNKPVNIESHRNVLLDTGCRFGIPHGYMLQVCNRSSMGAKRSLVVGAHIIDSGFAGNVFIDMHNIGTEIQTINPGDKIAQLIMIPVIHFVPLQANNEQSLYDMVQITMSDRGPGALGSTDKK